MTAEPDTHSSPPPGDPLSPQARAALASPALRARRFATLRTVLALVLREMSTTYGRSPGGYLWALLEPVLGIALLSVVFAAALRTPSLGSSFPFFYATGYLPFALYRDISNKTARSLRFSRQLLRYPAVRYIDAILARFLLSLLTNAAVACLLLWLIMTTLRVETILDLRPVLAAFGLAALLGLGIGTLNCYLFTRFPLWENLWAIFTMPLFLMSAVIYIYEDVPQEFATVLWFNPLAHVTGLARTGFFPTYEATYVSVPYVLAWGLIPLALGLMLLNRNYRQLLNL